MRRMTLLAMGLMGLLTATAGAAEPVERLDFERWYALLLQGRPVGYAHVVMKESEGKVVTRTDTQLTIARGQAEVTLEMGSVFTETSGGEPIEAVSVQKLGAMATTTTMRFEKDAVRVTQGGAGEGTLTQLPGEWLAPGAASRLAQAKFAEAAKAFSYRTIDPTLGPRVIEVTWQVGQRQAVEVLGKSVPAIACEVGVKLDANATPIMSRQYVDENGEMLRQTMALMPGMELDMVAAEEELAKAKVNPPDVLAQTLVKPEGVIEHPRRAQRAVYAVTIRSGEADPAATIPSVGAQRARKNADGTWTVTVDLRDQSRPDQAAPPTAAQRAASPTVDSDDPMVRELVEEALASLPREDRGDPVQRIAALRSFVHRFIVHKDLSIGFATASEVARTQQGDCTEHAVLLAALLRAAGVPSRTVSGLVYADAFVGAEKVFGYHMWTQAWLDTEEGGAKPQALTGAGASAEGQESSGKRGGWVDVDATLPEGKWFDAAHLALGVSSLKDSGEGNAMLELLPVLGRLQVRVVEALVPGSGSGKSQE